ncbi:MAG: hypothetical protein GTN59_06970, partial [Candidatus Dadabacteria bacterium]|nr:hypothetical protein [Candidatus Dadabacteria bacterium]
ISYKNIIAHLHKCSDFLPAAYATNLKGQVKKIENGIYDLAVLEIKVSDRITMFLVFGKIISARDSKGYYSAVLGVEDTGYYGLIDEFKRRISSCHSKVSLIEISDIDHITGLSNTFRCINAISMAGFVNDGYLPFSLFYSGGKKQMLSSLSNTILLTNIYTHRFTAISEKIGKELIDPVCYKDINNSDLTYKILVLWLWGHDMGHFLKVD